MDINIDKYLERFRVFHEKSLFKPDFNQLKDFRCPVCLNRLYWNRDKSLAICKSKRKDKFIITQKVYMSIIERL